MSCHVTSEFHHEVTTFTSCFSDTTWTNMVNTVVFHEEVDSVIQSHEKKGETSVFFPLSLEFMPQMLLFFLFFINPNNHMHSFYFRPVFICVYFFSFYLCWCENEASAAAEFDHSVNRRHSRPFHWFVWLHLSHAGIGYASIVIVSLLNIYYIVILAWGVYYLFQVSLRKGNQLKVTSFPLTEPSKMTFLEENLKIFNKTKWFLESYKH